MDMQVVIGLESQSQLPEDEHQITFSVSSVDPLANLTDAQLTEMLNQIKKFFTVLHTGQTGEVEAALGSSLSGFCNMSLYIVEDLTGVADLGAPAQVNAFTITPDASALPSEIGIFMTEHAVGRATAPVETAGTRPQARHTGQVRFGPLGVTDIIDVDASGVARVGAAIRTNLVNAYVGTNEFLLNMSEPCRFAVWSRADAIFRPVDRVLVNNAFDIQNSRGYSPSASTAVAVPTQP